MTDNKLLTQTGDAIRSAVHGRIVPDLLRLRMSRENPRAANENVNHSGGVSPGEFDRFVQVLLHQDQDDAQAFVKQLYNSGVTMDVLFSNLLGPAAVELGDMWCNDTASFGDVALGTATLHHLLRANSKYLSVEIAAYEHNLAILIAPLPGENHFFGTAMVEEYFQASGWRTVAGFDCAERELVDLVRKDAFDIVGLTIGDLEQIETAHKLIETLKNASHNDKLKVVVGGPAFVAGCGRWKESGADGFAHDAVSAVQVAFNLCRV